MALGRRRALLFLAHAARGVRGLVGPGRSTRPRTVAARVLQEGAVAVEAPAAELGLHGSESCFMPLDQMDSSIQWPRILRIAGVYPGIVASDVANPPATPPPAGEGEWTYDFPDAHGSEFGVVAVPGSDLLLGAVDPIAIITSTETLGLLVPPQECLVVIDRAEVDYDERQFFAYADANSRVHIRRLSGGSGYAAPDGWTVLGRVIVVKLKYDPSTMAKKGTWMEEDD